MIKTLLFDFGDVFLSLDKPATLRELKKLGIVDFTEKNHLGIVETYEKGLISTADFIRSFREKFPAISENQLIGAWNSILLEFPQSRMDFIRKLSEENQFRLILLSNTNELHIDWVVQNIPFFEEFKSCFDAFYLSHEINFRKPDDNIFEFVLKEHDLKAEDILFIDDTKENTETAKRLGLHIWNLDPGKENVTELFQRNKNLF